MRHDGSSGGAILTPALTSPTPPYREGVGSLGSLTLGVIFGVDGKGVINQAFRFSVRKRRVNANPVTQSEGPELIRLQDGDAGAVLAPFGPIANDVEDDLIERAQPSFGPSNGAAGACVTVGVMVFLVLEDDEGRIVSQ